MAEEAPTAEQKRLDEAREKAADWKLWGCFVSERAWGTVREDYSPDGAAWDYFPFEHSHLRAYRWNEDGIAGICDRKQNLCFAVAFWNGRDPILKERLFGLGGPVGNHGEDVKEYYYYLDNTPTHSYMKYLYKYPQAEFPYQQIYQENSRRGRGDPEYELIDTGVFDDDRYFDIFIEYAKASTEDISIRITAVNRGPERAPLVLLPTVWFRNTWTWTGKKEKPKMGAVAGATNIEIENSVIGKHWLACGASPELVFCDNETNYAKIFNSPNASDHPKDAIGEYVVNGDRSAVRAEGWGTKAAAVYRMEIDAGGSETVYLRLSRGEKPAPPVDSPAIFDARLAEAEEFYASIIPATLSDDARTVMRQALAGMLWSKQFYNYAVRDWLDGDPACPSPPESRLHGRNSKWLHLYNDDVISMPDKWEYPWYAAWDLAFHCVPLAMLDPEFAKRQLIIMLREWYMHPNGQIPAYEWAFEDVNPPVHAWAALRVYRIEAKRRGVADRVFLEKVFHKLLLNFTWWVNRKDSEGNNVFEGGFLGLDNIGVFDRSKKLPTGMYLEQSDGTSWMAMYSLNMLAIALELAKEDKAYEDVASKFFEHFVYISEAMNNLGASRTELWNERDGFYYDVLHAGNESTPIKLRSMVGLIPLFAVATLEDDLLDELPDFRRRTEWFLDNRPDLTDQIACMQRQGVGRRRLLALVNENRLRRVLQVMLSENEFLSDYGIRALSRYYKVSPYVFEAGDISNRVDYEPAESSSGMFGGNSNWRGPIWFPVNFLLIEAIQKFDYFYGDSFRIEFPTGSGRMLNLWQVSLELEKRLCRIFLRDDEGHRAVLGNQKKFQDDPHWRDYVPFYEYFHGDNGRGVGASHQTGWTGLVGKLLQQLGNYETGSEGEERRDVTINLSADELLKALKTEKK
jgi:hypothetical protein